MCAFFEDNFWAQVLSPWSKFSFEEASSHDSFFTQNIWLNSNILINNKPVCNYIAHDAGIKIISDILDDSKNL